MPLGITPTTLPDATTRVPYSQQLTGGGGSGSYAFTITEGVLPDGLTLSAMGLLSGTPTGATATFRVGIDDQVIAIAAGNRNYTLIIAGVAMASSPLAYSGVTPVVVDPTVTVDQSGADPVTYAIVTVATYTAGADVLAAAHANSTVTVEGVGGLRVTLSPPIASVADAAAALTLALRTLTYKNLATTRSAVTKVVTVTAYGVLGAQGSGARTVAVAANGLVVTMSATPLTLADQGPVLLDPVLTLAGTVALAYATITVSVYEAAYDVLSIAAADAVGLTVTFVSGVLQIVPLNLALSAVDSLALFQAALRRVRYQHLATTRAAATKTFVLSVTEV